jgi:hypothetical protein
LTTSWSNTLSALFGLGTDNKFFEYPFRALFFALNLLFNAIMWGLFTRALTLASSTVRVSVINTSANFMITAFLGALIFREALPGLWWLGAAMLVAGSVIIGRREEGKDVGAAGTGTGTGSAGTEALLGQSDDVHGAEERFRDEPIQLEGEEWGRETEEEEQVRGARNDTDDHAILR